MTEALEGADSAAFHDRLAAGYDAAMERDPGNAWVRAAFRQYVREVAPPGCSLLDFGCGTGDDALNYASNGMRVFAYDNSQAMVEELRRKCAGRGVESFSGDYATFLASLRELPPVQIVTANFAVLNMIADLPPLFSAFAGYLAPGGVVVASVLNPFYWRELRRPAGRRLAWQTARRGMASTEGELVSYRHSLRRYVEAAGPEFRLERRAGVGALISIERGEYDWPEPRGLAQRIERKAWKSPLLARCGKFWFLVFRRVA